MKTNLTYTNINGINYPILRLPEQTIVNIGKYGHLRLEYLKKHRRGTYTTLLTTCRLNEHLANVDAAASQRVRELTEVFVRAEGITEQLKATNSLQWAREMNNCKARAEEIVLREVVYR